jgi:S-DNA-T family DNA segregation ATPase FtsK/SpoIIIE
MIEMMEARGIIGPADGSRPRQVLMTEEEFYELDNETKDLN